jgi:hypothetical protein
LFSSQSWNQAKARLQFLADHHGAGLLTGEVGAGKSTAARSFTAALNPNLYKEANGYSPTRQNVSINIRVNGYSVDLVPGKRQGSYGDDHSLYRRKADTWTTTNVVTHINHVILMGRLPESRIVKLWRNQKNLDFPSFYLELTLINALPRLYPETLSGNIWRTFEYLRDRFLIARVVDPANTNNIISDDLSLAEKMKIAQAAQQALNAKNWGEIVP